MTKQQINPPFDGSDPCPMCPQEIRALSAYAHNMLNRWRSGESMPEPKFWVKLDDLVRCASGEAGYSDPAGEADPIDQIKSNHPDVQAHLDAIKKLVVAYRTLGQRPLNHEMAERAAKELALLVEELRATKAPVELLSEAHFDDQRHAAGHENMLFEEKGYSPTRGGNYHWSIERVGPGEGDIVHTGAQNCQAEMRLHQHFKDRIAKDRNFYGRVYCSGCRMALPMVQFTLRL